MRKEIVAAAVLLATVVPLSANDSATATKFLRDYVKALQFTRSGDLLRTTADCGVAREQYAQARNVIQPYTIRDPKRQLEMEESAVLFMKALAARAACAPVTESTPGHVAPLAASAVTATGAFVNNPSSVDKLWIGSRERRRAVRELEQTFGPLSSGPKAGQDDLETAAASLAAALAHPAKVVHETDWSAAGDFMRDIYNHAPEKH